MRESSSLLKDTAPLLFPPSPWQSTFSPARAASSSPATGSANSHKIEQQRLIELIEDVPIEEAARILHRPSASVRSMLHRLGLGVRQSREWFTVSLLAQALHIGRDEVRKWVDRGWLQCRVVQAQSVKVQIIDADDFCFFVKKHGREVVGNRLSYEGLVFVRDYVFPRPHTDLLSVRGPYNKEPKQQSQARKPTASDPNEFEEDVTEQSA